MDRISWEIAISGAIAAIAWGVICFLIGRTTAPKRQALTDAELSQLMQPLSKPPPPMEQASQADSGDHKCAN